MLGRPGRTPARLARASGALPDRSQCYRRPRPGIQGWTPSNNAHPKSGSPRARRNVFSLPCGAGAAGLRSCEASGQGPQGRVSGRTAAFLPQDFKSTSHLRTFRSGRRPAELRPEGTPVAEASTPVVSPTPDSET